MFRILVVEDDATVNKMICVKLKQEAFEVESAFHGQEAMQILETKQMDLIVCDIMMPVMDGYEFVQQLRDARVQIPVLMITAKDAIEDMEKGFVAGTDDYMIKPLNLRELVLRIRALLRRAKIAHEKKLTVGNTVLEYDSLSVTVGDDTMTLPRKEFFILFKLLCNPNKIFTRLEILDEIWGMDSEADERLVDSHIKKLRRRFSENQDFEIVTIRGLGYKAEKGKKTGETKKV